MFIIFSTLILLFYIRWDLVILFISINFINCFIRINGRQILFFDKNTCRSILVLLSVLIILFIAINRNMLNQFSNKKILYMINIVITLIILSLCFYSSNFFLFYFLFELVIIPTFFIVLRWGYRTERIQAGAYLFIYTLLASLPFLIFLINFWKNKISLIFDLNFFYQNTQHYYSYWWIIISGVFIVKIPVYLVHIWLPKAHVEAPVSGSIILAGILLKLGRYGFLKSFSISLISFIKNEAILISISGIGTLIIRLYCLRQNDLKCLVAYSSVAHINLIMISILSLSWIRIKRAIIMIVAHGLSSSAIFFILNIFYLANKSRRIIIIKSLLLRSPILSFWWFTLCCLNISCPPSINFVSEIFILISVIAWTKILKIILFTILIVRGVYSIIIFTLANHGEKNVTYKINLNSCNDTLILRSHVFLSFSLTLIIFLI